MNQRNKGSNWGLEVAARSEATRRFYAVSAFFAVNRLIWNHPTLAGDLLGMMKFSSPDAVILDSYYGAGQNFLSDDR